jgi:hypothetical protein
LVHPFPYQIHLNFSSNLCGNILPIANQCRASGAENIMINAKTIMGISMKIVTDANVSITAPKQPHSILRP